MSTLDRTIDISTRTSTDVPTPGARRTTLLSRLAARYVDGWTWYARDGGSPPATEPAYPMRRLDVFSTCRAPVFRGPAPPPRFVLLFGAAAGGR